MRKVKTLSEDDRVRRTTPRPDPFVGPWDPDAALKAIRQAPGSAWDTQTETCSHGKKKSE